MKRGLALLAAASLAASACGGSTASGSPSGAAGGSSTGSAGSTGAGGTGGPAMCQVNVAPVLPGSFEGIVAGPTTTVRVSGQITGNAPASFQLQWNVSLADGTPVPVTTVKGDSSLVGSLVEFPVASAGSYTISVLLSGSSCMGLRTFTAARPNAKTATFRLHVTPSSTEQAPAQDFDKQVTGGTPSGGNVLALDAGFVTPIAVVRADTGAPIAAYVRLTSLATGAVMEARTDGSAGAAPVKVRIPQGVYGMVVIPDGDFAPVTFAARTPADIAAAPVALDAGALVQGTVTDGGGAPIARATVVLRAGELVSTQGTTDAKGAFTVRARAGTFGLTVVSPLAGGGLESKLAVEGGLVVDGSTTMAPLAIKVQPSALATGTVALTAQSSDSLTAAARVTLSPMTTLGDVGTVAAGQDTPRKLQGSLHFSLHPAADGTVSTGAIPRGLYQMTVFPASSATIDGVTTMLVDLQAGSAGPIPVALNSKVVLKGKLVPSDPSLMASVAGTRLVALDDGGLPVESEATADANGAFSLSVSPQRSYALRALPRADQALARASFPVVSVMSADKVLPDRTMMMPPAVLYAGRVVDPSLQGVGAALVQAYCQNSDPACTDATVPVAETVTRTDGTFQLMLPDPDAAP